MSKYNFHQKYSLNTDKEEGLAEGTINFRTEFVEGKYWIVQQIILAGHRYPVSEERWPASYKNHREAFNHLVKVLRNGSFGYETERKVSRYFQNPPSVWVR